MNRDYVPNPQLLDDFIGLVEKSSISIEPGDSGFENKGDIVRALTDWTPEGQKLYKQHISFQYRLSLVGKKRGTGLKGIALQDLITPEAKRLGLVK